jgi:hypothetical protein
MGVDPLQELIELRQRDLKFFGNMFIYAPGLHYPDNQGSWQDNDPNWIDEPGFGLKMQRAHHHLRLFLEGQRKKMRFGIDRPVFVDYELPNVPHTWVENQIFMQDAWANTDLEYLAGWRGMKCDIVMKSPGHPASFRFPVQLLNCQLELDGDTLVVRRNGENKAFIPRPFLIDAHDNIGPATIEYDGKIITLTPSPSWLQSATYPVRMDPTTTLVMDDTANSVDTYIRSSLPNNNYGTQTTATIAYTAVGGIYRSLIKPDLSGISIPVEQIERVELNVTPYASPNGSPVANVHRITSDWAETSVTYGTAPTWDATLYGSLPLTGSSKQKILVTDLVKGWLAGTWANQGLLLKVQSENGADNLFRFYTSEYGTISQRPTFVFYYFPPEDYAQYITSFENDIIGQPPADWTKVGAQAASLTPVIDNLRAGSDNGKILHIETSSTSAQRALVWDTAGDHHDVEILARVYGELNGSYTDSAGIMSRMDPATVKGVSLVLTNQSTRYVRVADSVGPLGTISWVWPYGAWIWLRLKVEGLNVKAKAWQDGQQEPVAWQWEGVTIQNVDAGKVGTILLSQGNAYIDYFHVTIGDAPSGQNIIKVISESISLPETLARIRSRFKTVSETQQITEVIGRSKGLIRIISDNLGLTESLIYGRQRLRIVGDSLGITESIARAKDIVKIVSNTLGITEAIGRARAMIKIFNEPVSVTESIIRARGIIKVASDAVGLTEAINLVRGRIKVNSETISISEAVSRVRGVVKTIANPVSIAEAVTRARSRIKVVTENLNIIEQWVRKLPVGEAFYKLIAERRWRTFAALKRQWSTEAVKRFFATAARKRQWSFEAIKRWFLFKSRKGR